jgi:hypothetical protein
MSCFRERGRSAAIMLIYTICVTKQWYYFNAVSHTTLFFSGDDKPCRIVPMEAPSWYARLKGSLIRPRKPQ